VTADLLLDLAQAHRLETVPSTQDVARRLAQEGAPEGTVVIAVTQTAGRGREDRAWHSPPGLGLWMSFLLRPRIDRADWPALTAVVALGAAEALESLASLGAPTVAPGDKAPAPRWDCAVKWPNDLFGARGKLGGILAETAGAAVIVGLGLNLGQEAREFPPEVRNRASSLRLEGFAPVPAADSAARALNERLTGAYRAFQNGDRAFLQAGLRERFFLRDARVRVAWPGGGVEGTARDVGPAGEMILDTPEGRRLLVAGEVAGWVRPGGDAWPPADAAGNG
jgi:BirA family biotin operon repressor/biotin-[acetyl-CoA-carboxylase] ligase